MISDLDARRHDIPVGRESAISRKDLKRRWACSDRDARRIVADMRRRDDPEGYAILSTARLPAGYWRSADEVEIEAFVHEMENRARKTFVALKAAKRVLKRLRMQNQTAMDV